MTALSPKPQPRADALVSAAETASVCRLEGITKVYYKPDGSVMAEALRGVDLDIPAGQYVAIMGPSGSGKSTIMNILGCLDQPTNGAYYLDGQDVAHMSDERLSVYRGQKIGFIFQAFNLISSLRIEENVEVPLFYRQTPRNQRRDASLAALALVGLADRVGHRPTELSGGQQQRVAIARALVGKPVVLMADEPTGNLDSTTGQAILKIFDDLHQLGMTIIMVTHDESIAKRCQRVIRLRDGLIESDTKN